MRSHVIGGWWKDTGKVEDLLEANRMMLAQIKTENHGKVDADTQIEGAVQIGAGTVVGVGLVGTEVAGERAGLLAAVLTGPIPGQALPVSARDAIIGAAAGYLSLWLVFHAFRLVTGKEGMGYGDFKLFAALGAWLGWQMLPLVILLAAGAGAVLGILTIVLRGRDRAAPIPFGPYLATAGWLGMMYGDTLVSGYLRISGLQH